MLRAKLDGVPMSYDIFVEKKNGCVYDLVYVGRPDAFDGREARHTVMTAKLDGVPMTFDIFVEKKNGCVYDLVYVARPDRFGDGAPEFERFAGGFHAFGDAVSAEEGS